MIIEVYDENERFYLIDSYDDTVDGLVKDLNFNHDKYDVDIQKRDMIKCRFLAWTSRHTNGSRINSKKQSNIFCR